MDALMVCCLLLLEMMYLVVSYRMNEENGHGMIDDGDGDGEEESQNGNRNITTT